MFRIQPSCFVVFLSSNDWRKWVNRAFRKTPLFKNCRCERLSLLYISKLEIYNPLSALLLTLVCHFYYVLLRVAIFVLNVAIATYFERRQKELSTKTLLWKIYRGKVVQFFTAQPLICASPINLTSHFRVFLPFFFFFPKAQFSSSVLFIPVQDEVLGLVRDMFSFKAVRYSSLELLSEDILKLTQRRHEQLLSHFESVQSS